MLSSSDGKFRQVYRIPINDFNFALSIGEKKWRTKIDILKSPVKISKQWLGNLELFSKRIGIGKFYCGQIGMNIISCRVDIELQI